MAGAGKLALFLVPAVVWIAIAAAIALAQRSPSRLARSTRNAVAFWVTPVLAIAGIVEMGNRSWPWWAAAVATAAAAYGLHRLVKLADARALRHVAGRLGADYQPGKLGYHGHVGDAAISFRFHIEITRDSKGNQSKWHYTVVDATGPRVPLFLELRRERWLTRLLARRGYAVDIVTGTSWFDRCYLIEGAPRELILPLLDVATMRRLARQRLQTLRVEEGEVHIKRWGWRWSKRQLDDLIDIAGQLAGRPAAILRELDRELTATEGGPYRAAVDASRARAAKRARAQELGAVHAARDRRAQLYGRVAAGIGLVALAAIAAAVAYTHWGD